MGGGKDEAEGDRRSSLGVRAFPPHSDRGLDRRDQLLGSREEGAFALFVF